MGYKASITLCVCTAQILLYEKPFPLMPRQEQRHASKYLVNLLL